MADIKRLQLRQLRGKHEARQNCRYRAEDQIRKPPQKAGGKQKELFIELRAQRRAAFKKARQPRAKPGADAVREFVRDGIQPRLQRLRRFFEPPSQLRQLVQEPADLTAQKPAQQKCARAERCVKPQHAHERAKPARKPAFLLQNADRLFCQLRHGKPDEKRQQQRKQNRREQPQPQRRAHGNQHHGPQLSRAQCAAPPL